MCDLDQSLAAQVSLVRVVPSSSALYCAGTNAAAAVEVGLAYLQRAATHMQCAGITPDAIRTAVRFGDPAHELLAQAAREQATILVAARRTTAAAGGAIPPLHHSVTTRLLQLAPLPVLVVPAG